MKTIYLALLLSLLWSGAFAAEEPLNTSPLREAEISSRLQADVGNLLEQLVGKGKTRVFVNAEGEILLKAKSESATPQQEESLPLPGYAGSSLLEKTSQYIKQQREEGERSSEFRLKKLSVSLIFDRSVPDNRINAAKLLISDTLRLNEQRGDSIITAKADMIPWWNDLLYSPENRKILLAALAGALGLVILALFAYALVSKLLNNFIDYAKLNAGVSRGEGPAAGPQASGGGGETGEVGEVIDVETGAAPGGMIEAGQAFDFLEKLPQTLAAEFVGELPQEDAAIIIANLADKQPHLSSRLLLALPPEKKQAVTDQLISLKQAEPERIYEIENELRMKMEKSLKGTEKLSRMLSLVNETERNEIIEQLARSNPEKSREITKSLFTFEDICHLEEKNLRPVVVARPYADWACALAGIPPASAANVTKLMSEDVRLIVKDLLSGPQELEKTINARAKIIAAALELERKGRTTLPTRG
ncbi:MAG: hypothetical protein NTX59_06815 [Elusimicrobia bacterium]|nr:hypothetical protein [Elusimicrobiota bacterium]